MHFKAFEQTASRFKPPLCLLRNVPFQIIISPPPDRKIYTECRITLPSDRIQKAWIYMVVLHTTIIPMDPYGKNASTWRSPHSYDWSSPQSSAAHFPTQINWKRNRGFGSCLSARGSPLPHCQHSGVRALV